MGANEIEIAECSHQRSATAAKHVAPKLNRPNTAAQRRLLRVSVQENCENRPGVYLMYGQSGEVIYVGQSRSLRARLLSYFRARGRRNKSARILKHAHNIEWEYTPTIFGALLRELRLIKQYRPRFNSVMVNDEWPHAYIAVTAMPVGGLKVVRRSDDPQAVAIFGPFRRVRQLSAAIRALAETMHVRDCSLDSWPKGRVKKAGCLRFDLGTCPGPCIGEGDANEYSQSVAATLAFLRGESKAPIIALETAMREASEAMAFERAGVLRDRLELVKWLWSRLGAFHSSVDRLSCCYHATGHDGQEWIYLIRRGTVRAITSAPQSTLEKEQFTALVDKIYQGADPKGADIPIHDIDEYFIVRSWFHKHRATQPGLRVTHPHLLK